jgi:hypothetical protein
MVGRKYLTTKKRQITVLSSGHAAPLSQAIADTKLLQQGFIKADFGVHTLLKRGIQSYYLCWNT